MRSDQVFVLLLIILIPMTGCFDNSVGDAEGAQDSESPSDPTASESTGTENPTGADNLQSRTWYSSGGVYEPFWSDGQYSGYYTRDGDVYVGTDYSFDNDDDYYYRSISNGGQRCISWGPYYNSSTGELVGEGCNDWGYPQSESDWDLTDCTDNGGDVVWTGSGNYVEYGSAPSCRTMFTTINSSVGEAILIYQWSGFYLSSNCGGVETTVYSSALTGKEYLILPGAALECSHEIYTTRSYTNSEANHGIQSIWSVVYAIQDTTVV
jgi:hypothetical protein